MKKVQWQTLRAGDIFRNRKGFRFEVLSVNGEIKGEYHRQPRRKIELTVFDFELARSYEVNGMDTDLVTKIETPHPEEDRTPHEGLAIVG